MPASTSTFSTLATLFLDQAAASAGSTAIRFWRGERVEERTWEQVATDVYQVAWQLHQLGIGPGDRVAQLAENRYEWILVDLAIPLLQAIHVPIHAPLAAAQVSYQVTHSGAHVLIVSTRDQLAKLQAVAEELPSALTVVAMEPCETTFVDRPMQDFSSWLAPDAQAANGGRELASAAARTLDPEQTATILYTSGTTGQPKGVVLTHANLVSNACGTVARFGTTNSDVRLCFLPLSHIFARTCDLYSWLAAGNQLALATARDTVIADCQWAKPTVMSGVPYFYDRVSRALLEHPVGHAPDGLRKLLGGHIVHLCSGGAALPDHLFDFYEKRGIPILQGYGLTETSPVISVSTPSEYRRGASGKVLPGVEVKVADDGELLTRGPHLMKGYWSDPDATAAVIRDGWFHTGDLGHVDADGYVWITGRKKELIVTAAGKNVAPVMLESLLTEDALIEQAMVVGDDRNYLAALIVPNWEAIARELPQGTRIQERIDACHDLDVLALLRRQIDQRLAHVSYHEQIRKFAVLERPFSLELQELTPKMSLCRPRIQTHFAAQIEAMYGGG
jgi:long-chain acyl-CoA synthetase